DRRAEGGHDDLRGGHSQSGAGRAVPAGRDEEAGGGGGDRSRRHAAAGAGLTGVALALLIGAQAQAQAQAQGWTEQKCALYTDAWAHLEASGATAAASPGFLADHDAFLASG